MSRTLILALSSLAACTASSGGLDGAAIDAADLADAAVPPVSCDNYCSSILTSCSGIAYSGMSLCLEECPVFQLGSYGEQANSIGCRQFHADVAANTSSTKECFSGGPSGAGVCGARCDAYCALVFAVCIPANRGAQNPFGSPAECASVCQGFAFDSAAPELDPANHNTLNCRQYQLQRAWSDVVGGSALADCPFLGSTSSVCAN